MHIPEIVDFAVILAVMLIAGGLAAAWGVARYQAEGSRLGIGVAVVGLLLALYAPLCAMYGWPPLDWLRG